MNLFLVIMIVTVWSSVVIAEENAAQPAAEVMPDLPPPPPLDAVAPVETGSGADATSTSGASETVSHPLPELPPLEMPADAAAPVDVAAPAASAPEQTPASAEPIPAPAPATATLIPVEGEHASSVAPASDGLFSAAPGAATDVPDKVLFEQSEAEERKAREALDAIEKLKEEKLEAYLAFDAQLDDFFNQAGLVRGTAASDVAAIKKAMVDAAEPGVGVNDTAQTALIEQAPLFEAVERDMKALQEHEAEVIKAVKALSDIVLSLGDSMVQIQSQRIQMTSTTDHAMIVAMNIKIKESAAKIVDAQQSLHAAKGELKAVDDALAQGREKVAAAQKNTDALTAKNIHIAEVLKTVRASVKEHTESDEHADGADEDEAALEEGKKKSEKSADSWLMNVVKGTVFEAPYCVLSDTILTVWHTSEPARHAVMDGVKSVYHGVVALVDKDARMQDIVSQAQEAPLADPVLERIRIERLQSKQRVAELAQQREIIEMKDTLLDRLEAERIMQLDTKQDIAAELSRAYARHERELTWVGLFKRLVWKTYASARRLATYVYNWIQGIDIHTGTPEEGRGIEKDDTL